MNKRFTGYFKTFTHPCVAYDSLISVGLSDPLHICLSYTQSLPFPSTKISGTSNEITIITVCTKPNSERKNGTRKGRKTFEWSLYEGNYFNITTLQKLSGGRSHQPPGLPYLETGFMSATDPCTDNSDNDRTGGFVISSE